jgi:hypothetical protein
LGEFGEEQILRERVCSDCNQSLGEQVDREWILTGPEGVFRRALGVEGRRGPATRNPHYHRASTDLPVQATNIEPDDALPERTPCGKPCQQPTANYARSFSNNWSL